MGMVVGIYNALTSQANSKVNLLSDDTLMELSNCELVSSFRQIEQGAHYIRKFLIYSTSKAFLEKVVVT